MTVSRIYLVEYDIIEDSLYLSCVFTPQIQTFLLVTLGCTRFANLCAISCAP